jgi:hypothetical protein
MLGSAGETVQGDLLHHSQNMPEQRDAVNRKIQIEAIYISKQ